MTITHTHTHNTLRVTYNKALFLDYSFTACGSFHHTHETSWSGQMYQNISFIFLLCLTLEKLDVPRSLAPTDNTLRKIQLFSFEFAYLVVYINPFYKFVVYQIYFLTFFQGSREKLFVVYFDQHLGAEHSKRWSKQSFSAFLLEKT